MDGEERASWSPEREARRIDPGQLRKNPLSHDGRPAVEQAPQDRDAPSSHRRGDVLKSRTMNRVTVTVDPAGHLVMPEAVREAAGILPGVSFEVIVANRRIELKPVEMPKVSPAEAEHRGAVQIEAEIDQIYDDIRELVARSADDTDVEAELERKRRQLHVLKVEEAAVLRRRAESMRRLKPGEGDRLLKHAEELLAR